MKKFLCFLFVLLICFLSFAGISDVIDLKSGFYEKIDNFALLSGYSLPNQARPWTVSQAKSELKRINYPANLQEQYNWLTDFISSREKESFSVDFELAPQIYVHTNAQDFNTEDDWVYGFSERNPFLKASLNASIDNFSTYCELSYGWGKTTYNDEFTDIQTYVESLGKDWCGLGSVLTEDQGNVEIVTKSDLYSRNFLFNFPAMDCLEIEIPRRAYISFAGDSWSLRFSRDRLAWGVSNLGNFIFDSDSERNSYINLNFYNKQYGFDYVTYFVNEREDNAGTYTNSLYHRIFMAHRLYYRFGKLLQLAVSENIMYKYSNINFEALNPSYIYHQLNNSLQFNAIALFEIDATPINGLNTWLQFVVDQAQIPTEFMDEDNAYGIMLGTKYVLNLKNNMFDFNIEGAYASPALYRRNDVDFIVLNRYSTNADANKVYRHLPFYKYIGFQYGGDTIAFYADCNWSGNFGLSAGLSGRFACNGGFTMFDSHSASGSNADKPNLHLKFDNGNITCYSDITIKGAYEFALFEHQFVAEGGASLVFENKKVDFQTYLGLKASI